MTDQELRDLLEYHDKARLRNEPVRQIQLDELTEAQYAMVFAHATQRVQEKWERKYEPVRLPKAPVLSQQDLDEHRQIPRVRERLKRASKHRRDGNE
jgi:hypothetical protein